jgi:hypothetical protein
MGFTTLFATLGLDVGATPKLTVAKMVVRGSAQISTMQAHAY